MPRGPRASPAVVLRRPGWRPGPGDRWYDVPSLAAAAEAPPGLGRRVFLSTGRLGLAAFAGLSGLHFLVRSVEPPEPPLPPDTRVVLARGPFTVTDETGLPRAHRSTSWSPGQRRRGHGRETDGRTRPRSAGGRRPPPPLPDGVRAEPDVAGVLARLGFEGTTAPGA